MDPNILGPATLAVTQGFSLFANFLPPFSEIYAKDPVGDPDFAMSVRKGELAAALLTLGLGALTSALTGSNIPALIAALACAGLIAVYEMALRGEKPMTIRSDNGLG